MVAIFLTCVKNQYKMFISNCFKILTYIFFIIFVQIKVKIHSWRVFKGIHIGYKESYKIWTHLKEHIFEFLYNHVLCHICLWSNVVCFVLFVMLRSPKPQCFMPCSWCLQKNLDEKGCIDLVWKCLEL
jgi:hypothetical protein